MLGGDFVVFSVFGSHYSAGVSLLVGHSLNAIVNLVFADNGGQLVVVDIAIKSFNSGWSRFLHPIALARDAPFSDGWGHSSMIRNSFNE